MSSVLDLDCSVENETGAFRKKKFTNDKIAVDVYESKVNMKSKDEILPYSDRK